MTTLLTMLSMYIARWEMSTPILAYITEHLSYLGFWVAAAVANFIGALVFFWVDKLIFKPRKEVFKSSNKINSLYMKLLKPEIKKVACNNDYKRSKKRLIDS